MKIYIDIDDTICYTPSNRDYTKSQPIEKNIKLVNDLYEAGHTITMWTARGSASGKDWSEVTINQLDKWGVKRHGVQFGKPSYDVFIDDKVINARDWELRGNYFGSRNQV